MGCIKADVWNSCDAYRVCSLQPENGTDVNVNGGVLPPPEKGVNPALIAGIVAANA
jgi:hypothetical protein